MNQNRFLFFLLLSVGLAGCTAYSANNESSPIIAPNSDDFNGYWYQGKAEISRYELQQARYGEVHQGNAVLVFVTEDFRTDLQVKLESNARDKATPILKLNQLKKFPTGIYDYSMMTSVFQPLDRKQFPHALKVTTSSQEWCGHTYSQLNYRNGKYDVLGHSYFEAEADETMSLEGTWLEDEFWTLIRTAPESLPTGTQKVIPGTQFSRLKHVDLKAETAECSISDFSGPGYPGENLKQFVVKYPDHKRQLSIVFESAFPFHIAGWEDSYVSGWGDGARILSTKAIRTHQIMEPYWGQNSTADQVRRKDLGL